LASSVLVVETGRQFQRRQLNRFHKFPMTASVDQFCFARAVDGISDGVAVTEAVKTGAYWLHSRTTGTIE